MSCHPRTGGCLCGAVRYTVTGPAKSVEHCHCSMCRRAHGALYASGALIDADQLHIDRGEDNLTRYESSPGNWRAFCRTCGAQLFVTIEHIPGEMYYWAATLDGGTHPGQPADRECHIHVGSKASWEPPGASLPEHDGIPRGIGPGRGS